MKIALLQQPQRMEVVEVEKPAAGPDQVLVKIAACGVCGNTQADLIIPGLIFKVRIWVGCEFTRVLFHKFSLSIRALDYPAQAQ